MEDQLKARKLASASVRKQRITERQKQKEFLAEQREERRKRLLRYSELYNTDSDTSRSNSPENDSSVETPSEYSVRTPGVSASPDVEIKIQATDLELELDAKRRNTMDRTGMSTALERQGSKSKMNPPKPVLLGASLNRPCDFRYDRFSTIIDSVEIEPNEEQTSSGSENDDDDEDYSPLEVATPIAIRMPVARPSVISVVEQRPQRFSVKNINTIMITTPKNPPGKPMNKESMSEQKQNTSSGFSTPEPKPVEALTPSSASMVSVGPSFENRRAMSSQTSLDHGLKKKSSMPMFTKFTHARMNSIKNFMKPQSISGPLPAVPQIPSAHQSRPSEIASSIPFSAPSHKNDGTRSEKHFPSSPRRSFTEPPAQLKSILQDVRPQTARQPSQESTFVLQRGSMNIQPPPIPVEEQEPAAMTRKKSFSNLRRRSGSLGQALRFSSSRSKSPLPDAPLPPVPPIRVPTRDSIASVDFPTPPPKTAKSSRKSGMSLYSPFPPSGQKSEHIGLGLRI